MRVSFRLHSTICQAIWITLAALSSGATTARESVRSGAALPQHLSGTGLFEAGSASMVRANNLPFSPQYPLWSDGAGKRRWLYLPPGTAIDATNEDGWEFPRGTRLWKEFAHNRPIETRFIERLDDGSWRYASYIWNEQGTDAELAPSAGVANLSITAYTGRYDVPAEADCRACHEGNAVPVLGLSTLQLSFDRDPLAPHAEAASEDHVDLRALVARGLLKNLPQRHVDHPPRIAAATPTARAAIGYLHGNCGHCHNDVGSLAPLELSLAQSQSMQPTATLNSLLGRQSRFRAHGIEQRIAPGKAATSALVLRMRTRNPLSQMPPLGTTIVDAEAIALIERWINQELSSPPENSP